MSLRHSIRRIVLAAVVGATMTATAARAAPEPSHARAGTDQTFQDALTAYDAGNYAQAIDLFARVYGQTHAPSLLFNMAQAARLLGDCPRAVAHYRRFVAEDAASPDRPRAEAWLVQLGSCPGAPAPAAQSAPTTPPAPLVLAARTPAPPPPATVIRPLAPEAGAHPPAGGAAMGKSRVAGVILIGAAAACGGVAAASAWRAVEASDQVSMIARNGGPWGEPAMAIDRDGRRAQTLSVVFLSAALVSAAVGAYLLLRRQGP